MVMLMTSHFGENWMHYNGIILWWVQLVICLYIWHDLMFVYAWCRILLKFLNLDWRLFSCYYSYITWALRYLNSLAVSQFVQQQIQSKTKKTSMTSTFPYGGSNNAECVSMSVYHDICQSHILIPTLSHSVDKCPLLTGRNQLTCNASIGLICLKRTWHQVGTDIKWFESYEFNWMYW